MCSPASLETAYVQRASPTEPIVETCPSRTSNACWPKTSLVEKSRKRSTVPCVASAASSTLYVPMRLDRKSTRLNSSHGYISYAVFCLKKKNVPKKPPCSPSTHR